MDSLPPSDNCDRHLDDKKPTSDPMIAAPPFIQNSFENSSISSSLCDEVISSDEDEVSDVVVVERPNATLPALATKKKTSSKQVKKNKPTKPAFPGKKNIVKHENFPIVWMVTEAVLAAGPSKGEKSSLKAVAYLWQNGKWVNAGPLSELLFRGRSDLNGTFLPGVLSAMSAPSTDQKLRDVVSAAVKYYSDAFVERLCANVSGPIISLDSD